MALLLTVEPTGITMNVKTKPQAKKQSAAAPAPGSYVLTPEMLESITDVELAFSTEKLLPPWDQIPEEFKRGGGNQYTALAEAIFYGTPMPNGEIEMKPGFSPEAMNRAVRAHLQSWAPKHEHKIAGVGYMIACACEFTLCGGN